MKGKLAVFLPLSLITACARPARIDPPPGAPAPPVLPVLPVVTARSVAPTAPPAPAPSPPPAFEVRVVSGLPPAVSVTMDRFYSYACAVTRAGEVWCWRASPEPPTPNVPQVGTTPQAIKTHGRVTAASGACLLAGSIRCFGAEGKERNIRDAVSLADEGAAEGGSCAIRRNGRVACWYPPGPWDDASTYSDVPGVSRAKQVSVGDFGACAVRVDGKLVCWGASSLTQWAPSSDGSSSPKPTKATVLEGIQDVVHVSIGHPNCLVRATGQVHCWWSEDAPTLFRHNPLFPESLVRGIDDAVVVSSNLVLRRDGSLAEVHQKSFDDQTLEARRLGQGVLEDIVSIAGTPVSGCAVDRAGVVRCWETK